MDILLHLIFLIFIQVPFRLTRMLVKAMEVSGIEGNFRSTCENVMQVLRTNKDSVMAMMEVYRHMTFIQPPPPKKISIYQACEILNNESNYLVMGRF